MKETFVRDLVPDPKGINTFFLVHQKDLRFNKSTGEGYLSLVLGDRTGVVEARMWDGIDRVPQFSVSDVINVEATVHIYRNRTQLTIKELRQPKEGEVHLDDYFPRSERDPEEMFRELGGLVDGMTDPHLRALLQAILGDSEIAPRLKRSPAAKTMHHAFLGGLLEHVLSLCRLCDMVVQNYPLLRRDLLLTGCILHDIGKIYELGYDRAFHYTTPGQLLGHTQIGLEMVQDKIRGLPGFPAEWKALVEHMMLSHHGSYEFGASRLPLFPEALILHYLDDLDSKMEAMRATLQSDRSLEGVWTSRCHALDRQVLKMDRFLNGGKEDRS